MRSIIHLGYRIPELLSNAFIILNGGLVSRTDFDTTLIYSIAMSDQLRMIDGSYI